MPFLLLILAFGTQAALPPTLADGSAMPSLAPMVEQVVPAVVNIATKVQVQTANPLLLDPFFQRFFNLPDQPRTRQTSSAGSGVIVDAAQGYVLTNHHVIAGAQEIVVTLRDGRRLNAEVVGSDAQVDIAVLQIPAENLTAIPLNDATPLRVGDFVVAIGNPFGLGQTVTSGIVSALGRSGLGLQQFEDFIQTDASINPGNSGGALVNLRGELVGINSAILAPSGGNIGIGFAIPTQIATHVMSQLVRFGEVRRGRLGAQLQDLTPELANAMNLSLQTGALVVSVDAGGVADQAGLQMGDVILQINQHPINKASEVINQVGFAAVGDRLVAQILRQDKRLDLTLQMRETQAEQTPGDRLHPELEGIVFEDVIDNTSGDAKQVRIGKLDSKSKAYQVGLRKNDVLAAVNRQRIHSTRDLRRVAAGAEELLLRIERADQSFYVMVR